MNNSSAPPAFNATSSPSQSFPLLPSSLVTLFLTFPALRDWLKLIVIGSILETCRRFFFSAWSSVVDSFFITAQFKEEDSSYDWMMVWLSKQPSWKKAREVEVSTSNFGLNSAAISVPGEEDDVARSSRKLAYLPSVSATYSIWYKKRWMQISRTQGQTGWYGRSEDTLQISIMTRDHRFLNDLLLEAKKNYLAAEEHNISIYISDSNNWRHVASRPKRPLRSIVLDPGIKDLLIEDAKDFLASKTWYAERGIPFRRGYLLYGAPGSGKTSMIHSLAGELGLDVYVISLSRTGMDDSALSELTSELPERCIALMEDIDAAFQGLENRNLDDPSAATLPVSPPPPAAGDSQAQPPAQPASGANGGPRPPPVSRITLSGLLNAIDGIGAHDGRILYATTNKYSALDPALSRPGRMDLHVEFKLASRYQARELFRCFYLPGQDIVDEDEDGVDEAEGESQVKEEESVTDSGYSSPRTGTPERSLIDLTPADEKAEILPAPTPVPESTPPPVSSKKNKILPPPVYSGNSHRAHRKSVV
ncbi:hypothetical protein PILCRDRAFT_181783 [Piloderma croceum F 1598]|uniref:AAA+ ATPase domain-containing protein n=1 Tax=Piloderma croceum (strain F 1598) TaxID=765440 RepID=A0A0C3GFD5_PILCF|nr:hypothetical protein PILCRDRAFT_181783 [Piloderma croceum F 1598]